MPRSARTARGVLAIPAALVMALVAVPQTAEAGAPQLPAAEQMIVMQFEAAAKVRAEGGLLISTSGADISEAQALAELHQLSFRPNVPLSELEAEVLTLQAATLSGAPQPDLLGQMIAEAPPGENLEAVSACFEQAPHVEWSAVESRGVQPPGWLVPVPAPVPAPLYGPRAPATLPAAPLGDPPPTTPDYVPAQDYLVPNPGLGASIVHANGFRGEGVRVSDIEYGWSLSHEELDVLPVQAEPGITPPSFVETFGYDQHGTAALGLLAAPWNGFGINGLVPVASFALYPEHDAVQGPRRAAAILSAVADSDPGDILLLELQTIGPDGRLCPAEVDPSVHAATRLACDSGMIVIAAAGNGGADLDSPAYAAWRALGDSGAILVGAGTTDFQHEAEPFSTFGSGVHVQGWGSDGLSLGYGDFAEIGGNEDQAYTLFGGTSAAAAMVAGVAALTQSYALEFLSEPLTPQQMRDLLIESGMPQGAGPHIGPLVDASAAIDRFTEAWTDLGLGTPGYSGQSTLTGVGLGLPNTPYLLRIENGTSGGTAVLQIGATRIDLPVLGLILVPNPDITLELDHFDDSLTIDVMESLSSGLQPGTTLYLQGIYQDSVGSQGVASTNGLQFTAP